LVARFFAEVLIRGAFGMSSANPRRASKGRVAIACASCRLDRPHVRGASTNRDQGEQRRARLRRPRAVSERRGMAPASATSRRVEVTSALPRPVACICGGKRARAAARGLTASDAFPAGADFGMRL
jgi:hypothetical protein